MLIRVMDTVFMRIASMHRMGENAEAADRLAFVEGLLLHGLALVQSMKVKVAESNGPLTEADVTAFAEQLASMPEVAEPDPNG